MQILNISLLNNINNNNILSENNSIYKSHDYLAKIVKWIIIVIYYFINLNFVNINYNFMQWLKKFNYFCNLFLISFDKNVQFKSKLLTN